MDCQRIDREILTLKIVNKKSKSIDESITHTIILMNCI